MTTPDSETPNRTQPDSDKTLDEPGIGNHPLCSPEGQSVPAASPRGHESARSRAGGLELAGQGPDRLQEALEAPVNRIVAVGAQGCRP